MQRRSLSVPALALVAAFGCKAPVEAPAELDDLSRFLYRVWDDETGASQAAGLQNLEAFFEGLEGGALAPDTHVNDRSWEIDLLTDEDVAAIDRPDRALDGMIALGVALDSAWPVECHARMQVQVDQLPVEPTATDYERRFVGVDDGDCFPAEDCEILPTENEIRRSNAFFASTFVLLKSFRWFDFEGTDGTPRRAFYSRSWLDRSWPGEDDDGMMWQSYSIDVWMERPDGRTWRWQTLWTETDTGEKFPADWELAAIKDGTDKALRAAEDAIEDLGLCP